MKKITGDALRDIREGIRLSVGHMVVYPQERSFLHQMSKKAEQSVMMLTDKQYNWLLVIVDRVLTYNNLHGKRHQAV